ncbi:unnamed protein product [Gordionus sp. m RMFG-2023]|uniref:uncharacterized protein LOC135930887 n=1 Tax=Gordionus sp. m RMFG-2023 TaxID=3053472 RepID=UPI0030E34105
METKTHTSFLAYLDRIFDININKHIILQDHSYFRNFGTYHYPSLYSFPTQYLFKNSQQKISDLSYNDEDIIDVVGVNEHKITGSNKSLVQLKLEEAKTNGLIISRDDQYEDEWEFNLIKFTWSPAEVNIFDCTLSILLDYKLSVLSINNTITQISKITIYLEKYSQALREIFIDNNWNLDLIKWLHSILVSFLPFSLLVLYVEIIHHLICKIPWLITNIINDDKNIVHNTNLKELNTFINDILWNEIDSNFNGSFDLFFKSNHLNPLKNVNTQQEKNISISDQLSDNNQNMHRQYFEDNKILNRKKVITLMVPPLIYPFFSVNNGKEYSKSTPPEKNNVGNDCRENFDPWYYANCENMERINFWIRHLIPSQWTCEMLKHEKDVMGGKLSVSNEKNIDNSNTKGQSALSYALLTLRSLKHRIREIKKSEPDAYLIIWGWNIGSLLSCYACIDIKVDAVVCFGFPFVDFKEKMTSNNPEQTNFWNLDKISSPVIYVVGQSCTPSISNVKLIELLRSKLKVFNSLIVVDRTNENIILNDHKIEILDFNNTARPTVELNQNLADYFIASAIIKNVYHLLTETKNVSNEIRHKKLAIKMPSKITSTAKTFNNNNYSRGNRNKIKTVSVSNNVKPNVMIKMKNGDDVKAMNLNRKASAGSNINLNKPVKIYDGSSNNNHILLKRLFTK